MDETNRADWFVSSRSITRSTNQSRSRRPPAGRKDRRQEDPMTAQNLKPLSIAAALAVALATGAATSGTAWAQNTLGNIADNASIFIDGKTFEIRGGTASGDVAAQ